MSDTITSRQRPSYVVIVQAARDGNPEKITKTMGPHPLWKAEKLDDGVNINLNHDVYFTLILTKEELDERRKKESEPGKI